MFFNAHKKIVNPVIVLAFSLTSGISHAETNIHAEVWADNWFAFYVNEVLVAEDSTPFNTERSFNADSFNFSVELPAQAAIVMKDFYEDDSGLEYIGSRRQQMGDGGLRAQFMDAATGDFITGSNTDWQCHVVHQAPLNTECARSNDPINECESLITEEPEGWMSANFDDSDWGQAIEHSASAMRPHGEYDRISWKSESKLIWSEDLEVDNVILCRFTLEAG